MSELSAKAGKGKSSGWGGWLFLLVTVLVYGVIYLLLPDYGASSLSHFTKMVMELAPVLLLVFVFLWALDLVEGVKDKLANLAGKDSGIKGWLVAIGQCH